MVLTEAGELARGRARAVAAAAAVKARSRARVADAGERRRREVELADDLAQRRRWYEQLDVVPMLEQGK